jgi:hypothetical protein
MDAIDDFIDARRKGASQSFCLDTMQSIRGKLGSICNVKLAKILSVNLKGCKSVLREVKVLMEEISFMQEFNIKDNEQYIKLESILKEL